jgi:hypothetical protein
MYIFYKIYLQWIYWTLFFIAYCSTIFASELPEGRRGSSTNIRGVSWIWHIKLNYAKNSVTIWVWIICQFYIVITNGSWEGLQIIYVYIILILLLNNLMLWTTYVLICPYWQTTKWGMMDLSKERIYASTDSIWRHVPDTHINSKTILEFYNLDQLCVCIHKVPLP